MSVFKIRPMLPSDWNEVADLITLSTNYWYQTNGKAPIFTGDPMNARLFCKVYEALDPGCCVVAEHVETGRLIGSCFYHPRETHVSIGIMNAHPNYFGVGVARSLLTEITKFADARQLPVRLVSSAMNLDSFSLYTRAGFTPRTVFQDMYVPVEKLADVNVTGSDCIVRTATVEDVEAMVNLEFEVSGIRRAKDYRYFISQPEIGWNVSLCENSAGGLDGFLCSITNIGSNMLGPGIMKSDEVALQLIISGLTRDLSRTPVFLIPVERSGLAGELYRIGARNCELHFAQIRGEWKQPAGVIMTTFMPETG